MSTTPLKLNQIVTDAGTQVRAKLDDAKVSDYAEAMLEGEQFPAVIVFHDGTRYILADGFHRIMAASRNGFTDFLCEIHKGTKADALRYALSANARHGLPRSNADKRRSVELALTEWPDISDRELAKVCAVSGMLVADVRKSQVQESCTSEPQPRIGGDGKRYTVKEKAPSQPKQVVGSVPTPVEAEEQPEQAETAEEVEEAPEPAQEAPKGFGGLEHVSIEYWKQVAKETMDLADSLSAKELPLAALYLRQQAMILESVAATRKTQGTL